MRKQTKVLTLSLLAVLLFVAVLPFSVIFADEISYSDVLADLQNDETFDVSKYSLMTYDYFTSLNSDDDASNNVEYLSVIQIAESANKQLFVYTYQPLNNVSDIVACTVTIASTESAIKDMSNAKDNTDFKKYDLKCVSQNGALKKYLVENFIVSEDFYRYYCISEIERPFDTLLDEKISNDTITDSKTHKVGQAWCCYYENDKLVYEMATLDVVLITPTITDCLYYENGITWGSLVGVKSACLSHYIAFNIENFDVERIINASIVYKSRDFRTTHTIESGVLPTIQSWFGREIENTVTVYPNGEKYEEIPLDIYDTDIATNNGKGLFAKQYSWNRIMTAEAFVNTFESQDGEFTDSAKTALENSEFVFAFVETEFSHFSSSSTSGSDTFPTTTWTTVVDSTEIAKVDILRLEFVTPQGTFNLGVVSDTTSGDNVPGGSADGLDINNAISEALVRFMTVVFGIMALLAFALVFSWLIKYIFFKK